MLLPRRSLQETSNNVLLPCRTLRGGSVRVSPPCRSLQQSGDILLLLRCSLPGVITLEIIGACGAVGDVITYVPLQCALDGKRLLGMY